MLDLTDQNLNSEAINAEVTPVESIAPSPKPKKQKPEVTVESLHKDHGAVSFFKKINENLFYLFDEGSYKNSLFSEIVNRGILVFDTREEAQNFIDKNKLNGFIVLSGFEFNKDYFRAKCRLSIMAQNSKK
jgi:hypothetical protein